MGALQVFIIWGLIGLVLWDPHLTSAQQAVVLKTPREAERDILNSIVDPKRYDSQVMPGNNTTGSGPTVVDINMYVRHITSIDEGNYPVMNLQLTFRQGWNDPRLAYNATNSKTGYLALSVQDMKRVWTPDLFFSNEIKPNNEFYGINSYIRIFPDGYVLKSERFSLSLACPMVYGLFPFDTQICSLRMASYGYTSQDIIFKWKSVYPIQITSELYIAEFALTQFETDRCDSQTNTGNYSCLRADFYFQRYYQDYGLGISSIVIIIIAWLAFWLAPQDIVARLIINAATSVVLTAGIFKLNESAPRVSYATGMTIWTRTCWVFVLIPVVETIAVNYLARQESESENCKTEDATTRDEVQMEAIMDSGAEKGRKSNVFQRCFCKPRRSWSGIVDSVFKIMYPVAFAVFAIWYYCRYQRKSVY